MVVILPTSSERKSLLYSLPSCVWPATSRVNPSNTPLSASQSMFSAPWVWVGVASGSAEGAVVGADTEPGAGVAMGAGVADGEEAGCGVGVG